ncbi:MAG: hypothetical protein AAB360_01875 [Patescibacteria group bacterium]
MYHAVIIEESLADKTVLENYNILNTKIDDDWHLHIIKIPEPEAAIKKIQPAMVSNEPYYWHIFDEGKTLIVVFRDRVFRLDPNDQTAWREAAEYGAAKMNISAEQLDFYPSYISDEAEWLAGKR